MKTVHFIFLIKYKYWEAAVNKQIILNALKTELLTAWNKTKYVFNVSQVAKLHKQTRLNKIKTKTTKKYDKKQNTGYLIKTNQQDDI